MPGSPRSVWGRGQGGTPCLVHHQSGLAHDRVNVNQKGEEMARRLWAYNNDFGWYAVDPEECQHDRNKVDTLTAVIEAETKHALMARAEEEGHEIVMWLEP